jgi:2'-5' RNA ligase
MELYFVALILPEALNEMVQSYKVFMMEKYGCRVALNSPAHITFIPPFRMLESKKRSVIQIINEVSQQINSFWVYTIDFGSFPPRTIFIGYRENKELTTAK